MHTPTKTSASEIQFVCVRRTSCGVTCFHADFKSFADMGALGTLDAVGLEKFHLSFLLFLPAPPFSLSWNQSLVSSQSQIIHSCSSFVLVLTGHKAATQIRIFWIGQHTAPLCDTHMLWGAERKAQTSRHISKAWGQRENAPCQVFSQ